MYGLQNLEFRIFMSKLQGGFTSLLGWTYRHRICKILFGIFGFCKLKAVLFFRKLYGWTAAQFFKTLPF